MKVGITVDPEIPIPPVTYGGIERIVGYLVEELRFRGHDVTLFANAKSKVDCRLVPWPGRDSTALRDTLRNSWVLYKEHRVYQFDVIHSFSRIAYLIHLLRSKTPVIMTYQRYITRRRVQIAQYIARKNVIFTAVSKRMTEPVTDLANWVVIPNGVPVRKYAYREKVDNNAPLVFLGRVEKIKGAHIAIDVAKRSGRKLIIAGNIPEGEEHKVFYQECVRPHVDNEAVSYIGPVDDKMKNDLLGRAAALLMPVLWEEPFGIVMVEAMACGTPVIGFRRGAVPEVVEEGVTGYVRETVGELVACVDRIIELSRNACRDRVERKYSAGVIVDEYEALYRKYIRAIGERK